MRSSRTAILGLGLALAWLPLATAKKPRRQEPSALDQYIQAAMGRAATGAGIDSPGSLYISSGVLGDVVRDPRARQVDDIVTILVSDRASAVAKGVTNTSRKSGTKQAVSALAGKTNPLGKWANLANASGETQIQGQGQTSRETTITTTLSARVTHVLANGSLVVEGQKSVAVNSEQQTVTVRGVVRPTDIGAGNTVRSDQMAQLEVRVNGRGVVGDAIRRPFILYRILLSLLPF